MFRLLWLLLLQANMRFAHSSFLQHRPTIVSNRIRLSNIRHPPLFTIKNELSTPTPTTTDPQTNITVIGGGLAGLAVTYHLLQQSTATRIRIVDRAGVGQAGASSVAGGLLHPLSPRGKLVHKGLEGIQETNVLLQAALANRDHATIVLRDRLYRVALSEKQAETFQKTAKEIPHLCEWVPENDIKAVCKAKEDVYGGLLLKNGCQVIHVPSYLKGLWKACESVAQENNCHLSWTLDISNDWCTNRNNEETDIIVYAAGSGLFEAHSLLDPSSFPVQLVHGQSLELRYRDSSQRCMEALLCGKYVSPSPDPALVLVGSTHEFKDTLLSPSDVIRELKERTVSVTPDIWQQCDVQNVTQGTRVQSERGKHGRLPIMGKLPGSGNTWIFTGLSSRGLLYHAMYGKILARAILTGSEDTLTEFDDDTLWWKPKIKQSTR